MEHHIVFMELADDVYRDIAIRITLELQESRVEDTYVIRQEAPGSAESHSPHGN